MTLLVAVPAAVVTVMYPVVAPRGTWVTIFLVPSKTIAARVPLNATALAWERWRPVMVTFVPTEPDNGVTAVTLGVTLVVMRPIDLFVEFVNHIAPSGPAVIPLGLAMPDALYKVTTPPMVIRPIELLIEAAFVNHMAPSGPAAIPYVARHAEHG